MACVVLPIATGGALAVRATVEVHHLIEKRSARNLDVSKSSIPSILLTHEEHLKFTNAWRQLIPYNGTKATPVTGTATKLQIWETAQKVYKGHDEILGAINEFLFKKA